MKSATYLATDVLSLEKLAKKSFFDNVKNIKLPQAKKMAYKLYEYLNADTSDDEKRYIHITRYIWILEHIYKHESDKTYVALMYGSQLEEARKKQAALNASLTVRYAELPAVQAAKEAAKQALQIPPKLEEENLLGRDKYITCQQLYYVLNLGKNILIMDIRPQAEFEHSHLKGYTIINIDDALVLPGLSAHKLGESLPTEIKEIYNKRDMFEYIILVDFDTTQDSYMTSRLRTLYSIFTEWDVNTVYKHLPYILKGGYIDFIDRYPTYSTNPNVILHHKYEELDELLDLDIIQYPEEVTGVKEDIDRVNIEINNIYKQILDFTKQLLQIEKDLLEKQNKYYDPGYVNSKNMISTEIQQLSATKSELIDMNNTLNGKLKELMAKRPIDNIPKKAQIREIEYQIVNISRERRKLIDAHKSLTANTSLILHDNKLPETVGEPSMPPPTDIAKPEIPAVNRNTKPRHLASTVTKEPTGLVGLTNIRNTCYMNSIIQCLRHLPSIKKFFLSDMYERQITKQNPSLIREIGDLAIQLWRTTATKFVTPHEFYKKVTTLNPTFKRGQHEDANEFFMFIFELLLEDTAIAVPREKYTEPKFQTLYDRIQYKNSFFVREFFHQIRTDCICRGCQKKCLKYDIENVLMMAVPEHGSCSIEELYDEFMHTCDISDYYCRKCERRSDIVREFSFQPKIIAFLLKRYTYEKGIAEKITVPCSFPLENFRMGRAVYNLWAVSLHQGSMTSGHYTAVCLNPDNGLWYEFNDELVRPVDINARWIKEKVYMLFYESIQGSTVGFNYIQ